MSESADLPRKVKGAFVLEAKRTCTKCGGYGDISTMFGWRRMTKQAQYVVPQPQCYECRARSWK